MWDPISLFYCMWVLNIGMPDARLSVEQVIKSNEEKLVSEIISSDVTIRDGV